MTLAFYLSDMQAKAWGCIEGLKKILRSLTTIAMDDARKWEGGGGETWPSALSHIGSIEWWFNSNVFLEQEKKESSSYEL